MVFPSGSTAVFHNLVSVSQKVPARRTKGRQEQSSFLQRTISDFISRCCCMAVPCFIPDPGTQAQPVSGLCSLIWTEWYSQTYPTFPWFSSRMEKCNLCKNLYRLLEKKSKKNSWKRTENETNFLFPCSLGIVILSISLHTATAMDVLKTAAHFRQTN